MATFVQQPYGSWRAIVRRKQAYASKSFRLKADAERFQYGAVSWAHKETVIARIEATALGRDARFVVTNLPGRGKHHRGHVARSHAGVDCRRASGPARRLRGRIRSFVTGFLARHPRASRYISDRDLFETWIPDTPHVLLYRVDDDNDTLTVLALFHTAQDRSNFVPE